jgi:hypothetical protein
VPERKNNDAMLGQENSESRASFFAMAGRNAGSSVGTRLERLPKLGTLLSHPIRAGLGKRIRWNRSRATAIARRPKPIMLPQFVPAITCTYVGSDDGSRRDSLRHNR